jgi:hypothetical protein
VNGDVTYVTAINFNNITTDDLWPMPAARLNWTIPAPAAMYDTRTQQLVTLAQASAFNLTDYPFIMWAIAPAAITSVTVGMP